MPRIVKKTREDQDIKPYNFFEGFQIERQQQTEEPLTDEEGEAQEEEQESVSAEEIIETAKEQADQMIKDAREQAELLREKAFQDGRKEGFEEGFQEAYNEQRAILAEETNELKKNIADVLESISVEKAKLLEQYIDQLKRISMTVAEKIIQTSLQSSGDIIKRMIITATDKITKKQWAKIYITKCNTGISMEVDAEFLESLSHLSDNVKIVTMDNGEEGTCIIELPDEIIDASVSTQLENIKDILSNVRV